MGLRTIVFAFVASSGLLGGCVTEDTGDPTADTGVSEAAIRQRIQTFETLGPGKAYDDNLTILSNLLRDRAYPLLVEALKGDPSPRVRVSSALCLGLGQDDRAREHLAVAAKSDANPGVRYTSAYSLCLFRDSRGLPVLFEALRSDNPQVRFDANYRLKLLLRMDFAFEATGTPEARAEAVARWENWYKEVGPGGASMALLPPSAMPR